MFLPVIKLAKPKPISTRRSKAGEFEMAELIAQVAPAVERLLADGVPRSRREISTALEPAFTQPDVRRTLMRLAVTGRLVQTGTKYALPPERGEQDPTGWAEG
jgi:hypothetical protein